MATMSDTLNKITDRIQASASVKTIYGGSVLPEGKTLIPAAKVRYGFGASRKGETAEDSEEPSGAGGGVEITPMGVIEITAGETRYVSLEGPRALIRYALIAMAIVAVAIGLRQVRR